METLTIIQIEPFFEFRIQSYVRLTHIEYEGTEQSHRLSFYHE